MKLLPPARLLLALAYPWIAHAASARHDGTLAAVALGDIAVIVLLEPLAHRRDWAWLLVAALGVALYFFARSPHALLPLMLVPVAIVALVAWTFGRTLRLGRVPLITRIVCAMDQLTPETLAPELRVYTRKLTATWAISLGVLALVDLLLAMCAVPDGLLASVGIAPPLSLDRTQWSWFANGVNYGLIGALFVGEYAYRVRRFPGRYTSIFDFLRRMAALGPAFWRDALRG